MSYLSVTGQVVNLYQKPKGVNDEGEAYGGQDKVQLLCDQPLKNGENRIEMLDLTTDRIGDFRPLKGKRVRVPAGVFVAQGKVQFFMPKGSVPEELQ